MKAERVYLSDPCVLLWEAVGEKGLDLITGGKLFIARNKETGLHELVWVIPSMLAEPEGYYASILTNPSVKELRDQSKASNAALDEHYVSPMANPSVKDLDGLLRASNAEQFIMAISRLRPQFWRAEDLSRLGRRILPAERFAKRYETVMGLPDADMLRRETVLSPFSAEWECDAEKRKLAFSPATNKRAAERIIEKAAVSVELIDLLDSVAGVRYSVFIEPLQEWLFTRSLLWIAATFYSLSHEIVGLGEEEALAEIEKRSVFRVVPENGILERKCLVAPFLFNPYYRTESMVKRLVDSARGVDGMVNPLRSAVTEKPSELKGVKGLLGLHFYTSLEQCESVLFMTKQQALKPVSTSRDTETTRHDVRPVAIEANERTWERRGFERVEVEKAETEKDQRKRTTRRSDDEFEFVVIPIDGTKTIAEVLSGVIQGIHHGFAAGPGGSWECALDAKSSRKKEVHGMNIFGFNSIPAALWEVLTHHQGYGFVVCANCGNTVLISTRGAKSRYCSNSCRSAASKKRKEQAALGAEKINLAHGQLPPSSTMESGSPA